MTWTIIISFIVKSHVANILYKEGDMKRSVLTFAVFLLLTTLAFAGEYLASKNSSKYHDPSCKLAQKIKPENMVTFKSADEAANKGYDPCKRCLPGNVSKTEKQ